MNFSKTSLLICALLACGCGESAPAPAAPAPHVARPSATPSADPAGASGAGSDVPVARQVHNDPADLAAYRAGLAAAAQAGGGGGGGASRSERANYRHTERSLRDMSPEEGLQMLQEMRTAATQHGPDDGPCDRMVNAFAPMAQHAGQDPMTTERDFRERCEHMPREMQACFKEEPDQTPREQRYCTRLFGANTPFGTEPRAGMGPPPGTPPPTAEDRRMLAATQRRHQ